MIPAKLQAGDQVRVIAPSRSMAIINKDIREIANRRFEELDLKLSFGKHVETCDEFGSSSVEARLEDLHNAFANQEVKAILTAIGGFNCNQLLRYIDYDLIKKHPKILCGYSDITALQNAINHKTGLVTYSGPHYSTFGMKLGYEFNKTFFTKCLFQTEPINLTSSETWSDDPWYLEQDERTFLRNPGYTVIQEGKAEGRIVGGNLDTFNLLFGTEFMPSLKDTILFLEDDEMDGATTALTFDRAMQSLLQQPGSEGIRGVVIGRFQKKSKMTEQKIKKIIHSKKELAEVPVVSGADFGHTNPLITYPIGGTASLETKKEVVQLTIKEH